MVFLTRPWEAGEDAIILPNIRFIVHLWFLRLALFYLGSKYFTFWNEWCVKTKKTTSKHTCYLFKALHHINSMRTPSSTKCPLQWPSTSRSRNLMSVPQTKYRNCNTLRGVDCLPPKLPTKSLKKTNKSYKEILNQHRKMKKFKTNIGKWRNSKPTSENGVIKNQHRKMKKFKTNIGKWRNSKPTSENEEIKNQHWKMKKLKTNIGKWRN